MDNGQNVFIKPILNMDKSNSNKHEGMLVGTFDPASLDAAEQEEMKKKHL